MAIIYKIHPAIGAARVGNSAVTLTPAPRWAPGRPELQSFEGRYDSAEAQTTGTYDAVGALTPAQRDELRDAIDARVAEWVAPDGSVALPARTHVASASA